MHRDICIQNAPFLIIQPVFFWKLSSVCQFHQPKMCCVPKCISGISKESKVLWLRVFLFLSYMYAGAFLFMMIERRATEKQIVKNKMRMKILKNITTSEYNMTEDQFTKLIHALKPLLCSNLPEWSYEHATSFTLQLLTTIGRYRQIYMFKCNDEHLYEGPQSLF